MKTLSKNLANTWNNEANGKIQVILCVVVVALMIGMIIDCILNPSKMY